jgi:GNAT superfamily N-acetyltransferase
VSDVQKTLRAMRSLLVRRRVPDGLSIRKLRAEDLPRYFEAADMPTGQKWLGLQERNWLYVAVAEIDGAAVGRSCLMYNHMGDPPNAYSFASSVHAEWRSRGIGTAIMEHNERIARSRGLYLVTAHTAIDNPRARTWRERMGYRCTGEETINWTEPDGTRIDQVSWKFERTFGTPISYRIRKWIRRARRRLP